MAKNNEPLLKNQQLAFEDALNSSGISCTLLNDNYIFIEDKEEHRATVRKLCRQYGINSWLLDRPIPAKFLKKTNKLVVG